MKTITTRELNRKTADVLRAVERGETFELLRHDKAIGYLTHTLPAKEHRPNWEVHFGWLKKQKVGGSAAELDAERKQLRRSETELEDGS